jgi:hypothetical protein
MIIGRMIFLKTLPSFLKLTINVVINAIVIIPVKKRTILEV